MYTKRRFRLLCPLLIGGLIATPLALANPGIANTEPSAAPVLVDKIAAIVNKSVITNRELDERLRHTANNLKAQGLRPPPDNEMRPQVLGRFIAELVQLQYAAETGIQIDDSELDTRLNRIAADQGLSMPDFQKKLKNNGIEINAFRQEVKTLLILNRIRQREINDKILITDADVDRYLEAQQNQGTEAEMEYLVENIVIHIPEQAPPAQRQQKAARAKEAEIALQAGRPFGEVAAIYSDAPNALQGGQIGWRRATALPDLYSEQIKTLLPGQRSSILQTPGSLHILQLIDQRAQNAPLIVEQQHLRLILITPNEAVSDHDAKKRLAQLRGQLIQGADFSKLARLHSEGVNATNGGDAGWQSPGDLDAELEKAIQSLKPGEITPPVRTNQGWYLAQLIGRRQRDIRQDRQRLEARWALLEKKSEEQYIEWVTNLRDKAYIEVPQRDR